MRELKITEQYTNRNSRGLTSYLAEIGREKLLTPEEEVALAEKIHHGGKEAQWAREKLIKCNLRFVVSVAKQYQGRSLSLNDLINEGNIGLMKAASHFDETRGFKFTSYAVWWIRQSIIEAIGVKSRAVRVPLNAVGTANRIQRAMADYQQEFGWTPSPEELSDLTGLPQNAVSHGMQAMTHTTSIDTPVSDGSAMAVSDTLTDGEEEQPDRQVERDTMRQLIRDTLSKTLDPRQAHIICESFGIGCSPRSLEEISSDLRLSRERVRQLREKALNKLRDERTKGHLNIFL